MKRIITKENLDSTAKGIVGFAVITFFVSLMFGNSYAEAAAKMVLTLIGAGVVYGIAGEIRE